MINILRMNPSGTDGIRTIMTFEFVIDSTNDLPKDEIITIGERIYVIANNSIAINSKNNYTYSFNNGKWIRVTGKLISDNRVEAKRHMLDNYPDLRGMYDENDDNTIVLYFENAKAVISSFTENPKVIEF